MDEARARSDLKMGVPSRTLQVVDKDRDEERWDRSAHPGNFKLNPLIGHNGLSLWVASGVIRRLE